MRFEPLDDPSQMPDSYWTATAAPLDPPPSFEGYHETGVAIIGAGFTGLSTALHVAESGGKAMVLDANEPGWGASGRNNGQVVAELKHELFEIEQRFGTERAKALIDAVGGGPDLVFGLIERYAMTCDARRAGIITAAHSAAALEKLRKRAGIWRMRGAPLEVLERDEARAATGSDFYSGAVRDPRGGAINPLGYARGLARAAMAEGATIFDKARAGAIRREGDRWRVELANGSVVADRVIIATNGYTDDLWPGLKQTVMPVRTPQVVSEPLPETARRAILPGGEIMSDTRKLIVGVRTHADGRLHLGGGGGGAGRESDAPYARLIGEAQRIYPQLPKLDWQYKWSGFIALTPDFYPRLIELAPGVASCLGYSGRGVAMATIMGRELASWARGAAGIDELAFPRSELSKLPYYRQKNLIVEGSMLYYRVRERLANLMSR